MRKSSDGKNSTTPLLTVTNKRNSTSRCSKTNMTAALKRLCLQVRILRRNLNAFSAKKTTTVKQMKDRRKAKRARVKTRTRLAH